MGSRRVKLSYTYSLWSAIPMPACHPILPLYSFHPNFVTWSHPPSKAKRFGATVTGFVGVEQVSQSYLRVMVQTVFPRNIYITVRVHGLQL
jgi:hypothetical protein